MTKILFICHGNICRSTMAEFVFKDMVKKAGREAEFEIASAATSTDEIGSPVYPPVQRILNSMGIDCSKKRARQIVKEDLQTYDLLIGMDDENMYYMEKAFGKSDKLHLLMDFTNSPHEIADPWYTRDFEATLKDVAAGCKGLLKYIDEK